MHPSFVPPASITYAEFLQRLPKAELHCHLIGTLRPRTLAALARKHALPLPRAEHELYTYRGFYDFIEVFRLAARALVEPEDFARAVYEYVESAHRSANLRHLELFFNPSYHYPHGVTYRAQLDGIAAGARAAQQDFGVSLLLIPSIDREFAASVAEQVIDDVLAHRIDEVVGIGLDGPEDKGPPGQFAALYARAGRAGLKRTAHVCEDYAPTPAANYAVCRDVLGCERLDHGYRILTDEGMADRARDDGITFTACPKPSTRERDAIRLGAIGQMLARGIKVTLATDDPLMFSTDLADCYQRACVGLALTPAQVKAVALDGVDASWLDDAAKSRLRESFAREMDALVASIDPASVPRA
jgi:adenosine deaminase